MKKLCNFLFAAAFMMLAVTSCSQEEDIVQSSGEMTEFSISLNGVPQSRALGDDKEPGDGKTVNKLYYAVYQEGTHVYPKDNNGQPVNGEKQFTAGSLSTKVFLPLLKGEKYQIIFWAQAENGDFYDISNLSAIKLNYTNAKSNQECYDAFYNALANFTADGNTHKIELRRPFAQLNLGTSDWEEAKSALSEADAPVTKSLVKITGVANTFEPLTGKAYGGEDQEITFAANALVDETFTTSLNGKTYYNLSLNYLLVPGTYEPAGEGNYEAVDPTIKALVDVTYTMYRGDKVLFEMNKIPGVPVQRNYRTNIVGELLTGTGFDIEIKPGDDNPNTNIENIYGVSALIDAMKANNSTDPVIYKVVGLSTSDDVVIDIPDNFDANKVYFYLNDIKDGANLTIKDEDGATSGFAKSAYVYIPTTTGHNLTNTTINLPEAHVELKAGNFGVTSSITNDGTLVVGEGVVVISLVVKQGNVEIQEKGSVDTIKIESTDETPIIVTLGKDVTPPTIDNESTGTIIFQGTEDAGSNDEITYVAQVGDFKYTSLSDALAVIADEGEIKMIADYEPASTITIPANKTITLDLNGKTISQEYEQTAGYQMILNDGNLTIMDSMGNGKISYIDAGNGGEYISNAITNRGTLIVKSGTIENLSSEAVANNGYPYAIDTSIWGEANEVVVNIEGGTISSFYSPLRVRADSQTKKVEANISGGNFIGRIDHQMSSSKAGVIGILNISGGTFTNNIKNDVLMIFGAGVDTDASGIVANISGGIFNGNISINKGQYVPLGKGFNKNFITGGTFAADPTEFLAAGYFTKEENSKYIVYADEVAKIGETTYPTLNKAIEAVNDGGTITLLKDEIFTEKNRYNNGGWWDGLGYSGDKSFTIDLGGNTISQEDGALNDYLMWFKNDGSKDNTITLKNGTLDAGTTAYSAFATASSNAKKITINLEDINLINNISNGAVVKARGGSELNVKAGTIIEGKDSYVGIEAVGNNTVVNIYDGAEIYQKGTSSYVGAIVGASYNATMNIYGGYGKSAKCGIIVMSTGATINVSGGEWIANNDGPVAGGNQGVLVSQNNRNESGWACKSVMNVTGGTFKGGYDCWGSGPGVEADDAQINIKGGNFNADPTQYVVAGYEVTGNSGNYTVGKPQALVELESAIAKGGNVTLTNDVTLLESLKIENTVVLDLNGKTITAPLFSAFEVKAGGDLTLENGKVVAYESTVRAIGGKAVIESGEYTSTGTAVDSPSTYRYSLDCREGGELVINGGTFKSNNGMINVGSAVTINGGKFENIVEKSMTRHFAYVSGKITITDGEFSGKANSSAGGCFFCGAAEGCDIQIKGGKFTSLWTSGSVNRIFEVYYGGTINVTGGMFNTNGGIATFVTDNTDAATKDAYPYVAK